MCIFFVYMLFLSCWIHIVTVMSQDLPANQNEQPLIGHQVNQDLCEGAVKYAYIFKLKAKDRMEIIYIYTV